MVGGQESTRSTLHLAELFRLADQAGLLRDPERAAARMRACWRLRHRGVMRCAISRRPRLALASTPRRSASSATWSASSRPAPGTASGAIAPWRDQVATVGLERASRDRDAGLQALRLLPRRHVPRRRARAVRGARRQPPRRRRGRGARRGLSRAGGRRAAAVLAAGLDGLARHLAGARQVEDGIAELLDYARSVGMPLALEPLHPMYAADRACVNTLAQALDICDRLDPDRTGGSASPRCLSRLVGPRPVAPASRAPAGRVCSLPRLRLAGADPRPAQRPRHDGRRRHRHPKRSAQAVEAVGYAGFVEVEIFSELDWWRGRSTRCSTTCIARHKSGV